MDRQIIQKTWQIARDRLRLSAAEADLGTISGPVSANIRALAAAGLLGLAVPREHGGLGADEATRQEFHEILASACGVTAFTQQQMQTAATFLSAAVGGPLKESLLPRMARGDLLCGVALSHLRRSGAPCVTAERAAGGFVLNGFIPWLSGWGLIDGFLLGATVSESGEHLFVYVDIGAHRSAIEAGPPMPLVVMNASGTVEARVRNLFVSEEAVASLQPADSLRLFDEKMITSHTALPLGCVRGSAECLRDLGARRGREELVSLAAAVSYEADHCRREALAWNCDCAGHPEYKRFALRARAQSIVLALRSAQAAVAASGGRAHLATSTPQRLMREAQFYTTAVQTPGLQAATLDTLFSPLFGL